MCAVTQSDVMKQMQQRQKKIKRIAVLIGTSTGWGRNIITGINEYAIICGNWMLYIEPVGVDEVTSLPKGWKGDGIIARISNESLLASIKQSKLPCVNVSALDIPGVSQYPRVTTDHIISARTAFEHLHGNGFRSFGYFGVEHSLPVLRSHKREFEKHVRKAKCVCSFYAAPEGHLTEPDWSLKLEGVSEWLKKLPRPCGIVTWSALGAYWVIHAAEYAGLSVPDEIAVLNTSEDDFLCQTFHVPVSSLNSPQREIGLEAAKMLGKMMEGKRYPKEMCVTLPPRGVITRQSTDTLAINDEVVVKTLCHIREQALQGGKACNIDVVANAVGCCRRKLEMRFMEAIGHSIHDEVIRVRMERSCKLLVDTTLPINEVAERSGYATFEHFATYFKKRYGKTPRAFRMERSLNVTLSN
jgi:LacI family transcriptional regulator